jgi:2-oxoglutarate ferredoxin oxidoreductase subunit alpha
MSEVSFGKPAVADGSLRRVENEFTIQIATVNGSGSTTANSILLRALFKMGIPVAGKNIFPSNIQGMPTWYSIRLSDKGAMARSGTVEVLVAMNPMSFAQDIASLAPGGALFMDQRIALSVSRDDIVVYRMPVKELVRGAMVASSFEEYASNMVYVGVLATMLGLDGEALRTSMVQHFGNRQEALGSNWAVVAAAADWASKNLRKSDPYYAVKRGLNDGKVLVDGNTAASLGAIFGGVQFAAWYPITPATSLAEQLGAYLPRLRNDGASGKKTFAVVQAEDELAAIGMAAGAGWAGLRSMVSTSGPGFSLMAEYLGLAYYAEVPLVLWDVQRVGPGTGLPTRTAQGDLTFASFISHGDTTYPILLPASPKECFEFAWKAFDLAERLQTPVIVLSDLDLGMNEWISEPFVYPERPMDRGKVLWEDDIEPMIQRLGGSWGRYLDVDGDGIPYRTLPGNELAGAAYLTRGSGHNEYAVYSEDAQDLEQGLERLRRKLEAAGEFLPQPVEEGSGKEEIGIIAFGSSDPAVREAMDELEETGIRADYLRVRAMPFAAKVGEFLHRHERVFVVEQNRDGQMARLLRMAFPEEGMRMRSTTSIDGLPLTAGRVLEGVLASEEVRNAK